MHFAIIICFTAFAGVFGTPAYLTPEEVSIGEPLEIQNTDLGISNETWIPTKIAASKYCVSEHNKHRADNGLKDLIADARLEAAARYHNKVMVKQDCFSHQCKDEPKMGERVTQQGYKWSGVAENIAKGNNDCKDAVRSWMDSKGHKKNLLGNYRHIGCHMLNRHYTCVFGKPL